MVIFLLDENKIKANADRLENEGYTTPASAAAGIATAAGAGATGTEGEAKKAIKRPGSIHAEMNSPARIYFKTVSSNKKLPPAVIYYHSLSSNKQIKDHSVRLPTPPATAAAIYYHRLDKNQQAERSSISNSGTGSGSVESTPSRQAAAIYSQALDRNRTSKHNSKYTPLGQEEDPDNDNIHLGNMAIGTSHGGNSDEAPMSPGSHGRSSIKSWPNRRSNAAGHLKPPLSPTPTSPPMASKMLMKGGAFQKVYQSSSSQRQPPSPGSPGGASQRSRKSYSSSSQQQQQQRHQPPHPPSLPLTDDKPPSSPPAPLAKLPSLLKPNRKYHRDVSRPLVSASSTLSSKSSDDSNLDDGIHSHVVNSKGVAEIEVEELAVQDDNAKRGSCAASQTSSGSTNTASSVKFGRIEILDFPIRLGDNPSVRFGAPIALGEKPTGKRTLTVEEYEKDRAQRLKRNEIVLDVMVRSDMLKQAGFSQKELRKAISEAAQARASRKKHAEKFLKEHGWGSILASSLEGEEKGGSGSDCSGSVGTNRSRKE